MNVDESSEEYNFKFNKLLTYTIGSIIIIAMLMMGSCTMHGNTYEPELKKERTAQLEIEMKIESQQATFIKELIDDGINPIAANCAVKGWKPNDTVCLAAGVAATTKN